MSLKIEVEITGVAELIQRLDGFKRGVRGKILRTAVTKSTRIMLKRAKSRVPFRTRETAHSNIQPMKLLKKSLAVKIKTYGSGAVVGVIGPRKGMKTRVGVRVRGGKAREVKTYDPKSRTYSGKKIKQTKVGDPIYEDPVNITHLVEFGTKTAKAQPFLRPALEESRGEVYAIFEREINDGIAAAGGKG
jgi:HK97 gp10 family phage protein